MALPELYRYGREGHWFNMKLFLAYMLDGIVQVRPRIHFLQSLPMLIAYAVDDNLLPHPVHLRGSHFPIGWLRRLPIRVFYRHGHSRCSDGQFLQWAEHQCLDRLGILRRGPRQRSHLVLHCERAFRGHLQ